ncbi:MAG: respiratory nitrate reductase subunit gamma [Thermoanaerobaculia bacterium]
MSSQPMQSLLLVGLPYAAIVVFLAGLIWRYRSRFTISSLSSQILESRWLVWGSVPFHLGIVLLFFGHVVPVIVPGQWQTFVSNRSVLLTVESMGRAAAILCLAGLVVLFVRRVIASAVRSSSTIVDLVVLAILIVQVALGLGVATMHRWGAIWSVSTTTPYLWSVITLRPDPALVAALPPLITFHVTAAWIVLALVPFTRLVHMLALPLGYLARPPQKVVWATSKRRMKERKQANAGHTLPQSTRT